MPRCKSCKNKFEVKQFNQKYCLEVECQTVRAVENLQKIKRKKAKEWKQRKKKLSEDLETIQSLMKKAQKAFNTYIRERDKGKKCISCNNHLKGKFDAGHYYSSGGHKAVTFDENNTFGQCVACNQHKHGNLIEMQKGVIKRIGACKYKELTDKAYKTVKYTRTELKELIKHYKEKVKELKNK